MFRLNSDKFFDFLRGLSNIFVTNSADRTDQTIEKKAFFYRIFLNIRDFLVFLSVFRSPTLCAAPPKYMTLFKKSVLIYCIFWRQPLTVGKRGAKLSFQKHRFYVGENCVGSTKILETTPDECNKLRILSRVSVRPILVRSNPRIFSQPTQINILTNFLKSSSDRIRPKILYQEIQRDLLNHSWSFHSEYLFQKKISFSEFNLGMFGIFVRFFCQNIKIIRQHIPSWNFLSSRIDFPT